MKPKHYIVIAGLVALVIVAIAVGIAHSKSKSANSKIALLEKEKFDLRAEKELLALKYDSLGRIHQQMQSNYERQREFADSMVNYLSIFGKRIVLIHENDSIVGSMDIGGQLRAYTEFLNMAEADGIR